MSIVYEYGNIQLLRHCKTDSATQCWMLIIRRRLYLYTRTDDNTPNLNITIHFATQVTVSLIEIKTDNGNGKRNERAAANLVGG